MAIHVVQLQRCNSSRTNVVGMYFCCGLSPQMGLTMGPTKNANREVVMDDFITLQPPRREILNVRTLVFLAVVSAILSAGVVAIGA